jgi:hypothetical protein
MDFWLKAARLYSLAGRGYFVRGLSINFYLMDGIS